MPDPDLRQRYESWVRSYAAELYGFAYRLCRRPDAAEDLVQETFCEAWRNVGLLNDSGRARSWLFQILRHRFAHGVRDQGRRVQPTGSPEAIAEQPQNDPGPLETLAQRDAVQAALEQLEEDLKVPFLMVFVEGLSCREAAEQLQLPLGTILSRIHRARQVLRGQLGPSYGPPADPGEPGPQEPPAPDRGRS